MDYETMKGAVVVYLRSKTGKAPATYNIPYSNLNSFFNWLVEVEKVLVENPIKALKYKKIKDVGSVRHLEEEEITKLLKVINIGTYSGLRDYGIILLTLDTGIRPAEVFALKHENFSLTPPKIHIPRETAKTRVSRDLPITP